MKEKRILRALGNVDNQYIAEAEPMKKTKKMTNRHKWTSIAACFAIAAVIGLGFFQSGLLGTKTEKAVLNNGETITFVKCKMHTTQNLDLDVITRPLNDEEIKMLFPDLPVTANAYFDTENHEIIGFEGKIDDMKLVVSEQGVNLLDTVIEGDEYTSKIGEVSINAGYFVTKANSQGAKTVIYYATFDIGENTVYVEYSGAQSESDKVKNDLADTVIKLIKNGELDLSKIKE